MSQPGLPRSSSRSKRSTTNLANLRLAPLSAKYTEQPERSGPKTPYDEAAEATLAKYVYRQGRSLPSTPGLSPGATRRHASGGLSRRESMLDDDQLPEIFHQYARSNRSDDGFDPLTKSVSEAAISGQQALAGQGVQVKKKGDHKRSKTVGTNTPRSKSKNRLIGEDNWLTHTGATANALLLESKGATWMSSRPPATNLVIADDDDDEGYEEMAALSVTTTRAESVDYDGQKTPKQEKWGSRFGSRPASRHASRRGSVAAGTRTPTGNTEQLAEYFERASIQQQYQQGLILAEDSEADTEDDNDERLTELTKDRSFGLGPYVDKLMFSVFNLPEDESGTDTGNEAAETAAEAKARRLREAKRRQQEKERLVALPALEDGKDGEKVGVWQDVSWLVNVAQRTFL